jgi:hypothetical protein
MAIDVSYVFICVFATSFCDEWDEPLATTYSKSFFDKIKFINPFSTSYCGVHETYLSIMLNMLGHIAVYIKAISSHVLCYLLGHQMTCRLTLLR